MTKDLDSSIEQLGEQIKRNPRAVQPYMVRGGLRFLRGEYELALADLEAACALAPTPDLMARAWLGKGRTYAKLDRPQEAVESFRTVIGLVENPAFGPDTYGLANEAREELEALGGAVGGPSNSSPPPGDPLGARSRRAWEEFNHGVLLVGPEVRAKAEEHLRAAIALKPDEGVFHLRLGGTLEAMGRRPEARREYEEAARLMPDEGLPHFLLGNMVRDSGALELAAKLYTQALSQRLDPDFRRLCEEALAASRKGREPR